MSREKQLNYFISTFDSANLKFTQHSRSKTVLATWISFSATFLRTGAERNYIVKRCLLFYGSEIGKIKFLFYCFQVYSRGNRWKRRARWEFQANATGSDRLYDLIWKECICTLHLSRLAWREMKKKLASLEKTFSPLSTISQFNAWIDRKSNPLPLLKIHQRSVRIIALTHFLVFLAVTPIW